MLLSKNFSATTGYSYIDARLRNVSPFQETGNARDAFLPPAGTGLGSPNFAPFPVRTCRQPDLPRHAFSSRAGYTFDNGFGGSVGARVTGPQNLTFNGSVKIPAQYMLDAALFHVTKHFEVRLDFYNLTDRRNRTPVADFEGGDSVFGEQPFHPEGTVRFKF